MVVMVEEPNTDSTSEFSCSGSQVWVSQAHSLLKEAPDSADMEKLLAELVASDEELSEAEREQLAELADLMSQGDGQASIAAKLRRDGEFEVTPSEDRMFMSLAIQPPLAGGEPISLRQILDWLKAEHVQQGVDLQVIRKAVETASEGQDVREEIIVRGRGAEPGQDEYCELFGRESAGRPLNEVGLPDKKTGTGAHLICEAGDRILHRVPAQPGQAGYNALGEVLEPPKLARLDVQTGPNVSVEGNDYLAEIGGVVLYRPGHIEVKRLLVVNHEVTSQNSPIDFDGEIQIRGAVRDGACVRAVKDITIDGAVEAAEIESREGSIILRHGVVGRHSGVIRAKCDVTAQFAENAAIYAGRNIMIRAGAMHSQLVAGATVSLVNGRGQVIGGMTMAGDSIEVKQLGSASGVRTELSVGLPSEAMSMIAEIDRHIGETQRRRDESAEIASRIRRTVGDPRDLTETELKSYLQLRQLQLACDCQMRKANNRREEILEDGAQANHGHVDVWRRIMPHVIVRIGNSEFYCKEERGGCKIVYDTKDCCIATRLLR